MTRKHRSLILALFVAVLVVALFALSSTALATQSKAFLSYATSTEITQTVVAKTLTIAPGAVLSAKAGFALTLVVNGVETGGFLKTTDGTPITEIKGPATYKGEVWLVVTQGNPVDYKSYTYPFRQALYFGGSGFVAGKSVLAAVIGKKMDPYNNVVIRSTGQNFNGLYVAGGDRVIRNLKIRLTGNGRSDFAGYGAGVVATGSSTRLTLDNAEIINRGVVRTGVIATGGSNVVVKNSYIQTYDGVLPADYVPSVDQNSMRSVPWMLRLSGNNRATNILGTNTKAAYINSYIGAEGWGVLSTDDGLDMILTAINDTVAITGKDGYGSYAIGNATERFLGTTLNVATYAAINRGGALYYDDSDSDAVADLNTDLNLGLSDAELAALPVQHTVVNSGHFGIMWHGQGSAYIGGGTVFNTAETSFLDKGAPIDLQVDGSEGAQINPGNGVIFQFMNDDDPGPVFPAMTNTGVYHEPSWPPAPVAGWDLTSTDNAAAASFSHIALVGDFFNAFGEPAMGPPPPPPPAASTVSEPGPPPAAQNMALTFTESTVEGVISASRAQHSQTDIGAEDYELLGEITNTPCAAINNGVIVVLADSVWTVTDTSYLTSLTVDADSEIVAPAGYHVVMTVDGTETTIVPGAPAYTGAIVLTLEADL